MKGMIYQPELIQAIVEVPLWLYPHEFTKMYARYQQGETVYVKEAWYVEKRFDHLKPRDIPLLSLVGYPLRDIRPDWAGKLRSLMFLRQEFARYFIVIESVRAERLQEITEEDAEAEGLKYSIEDLQSGCSYLETAREKFEYIWNSINKDYPFESNPWVWVCTFRLRQEMPIEQ